ncbi:hypothetical protein V6N13_053582 [Hibiscus sabdariffa]
MSPDSLLHQFDDLKFIAEEQDVVFTNATTVAILEDDPRFSLVGRVITSHAVDGATLIRVFRAVWKPTKEVRTDILKRGPWVFNDDWFAILPLNPMLSFDEYFFTKMIIWVRILRILIGLMSESLGHSLGACTGSAVGIDMRIIDGNMGEFLRVQISIDVSKPLRRCVALGGCGHLVVDCHRQPYDPLLKFRCGAGARADVPSGPAPFVAATPLRSIPVLASIASPLGVATATSLNAEEGVVVSTEATVSVDGSHDVLAVDVSSKVRITDNILFGDERDVFVTRVAHEAVAPAFDAIEEWLAEDNDSDVQITVDLPVKIPAKRSSGGSDPSKAKRARCGLLGHSILICLTTPKVEGQKLQYGAWLRAPQPKRSASRPRGRVSLFEDDVDASVPAPTAASGSPFEALPTEVASAAAPLPASDSVAASLAPENSTAPTDRLVSSAPTSSVQATAVTKDVPHDPMVHTDASDMLEEAIEDASLVPENSATVVDRLASSVPISSVPDTAVTEDVPYDPMVHNDTSDMLEEAL